jgi:excisionase family DNA binding protein
MTLEEFVSRGRAAQAAADRVSRGTSQTSPTPDVSDWLTKAEAARALGLSEKGVERLVQEGQIQQARRRGQKGGARLAVYHPADVARVAATRDSGPPAAFLVPGTALHGSGPGPGTALAPAEAAIGSRPDDDVLRQIFAAALRAVSETSQTPTVYMRLGEAAARAGLSPATTRRLIKARGIRTVRDGRGGALAIHRAEFEALL